MKRILLSLIIVVILAACSPDPDPPPAPPPPVEPNPYFGYSLSLSGNVYTRVINFDFENFDPDNIDPLTIFSLITNPLEPVSYAPANNTPQLTISDNGLGGSGEIKDGRFGYSIEELDEDYLIPINEVLSTLLSVDELPAEVDLSSIQISSTTAQAAFLTLLIAGDSEYLSMNREKIRFDLPSFQTSAETVSYLYVDENVTITAPSFPYSDTIQGIPVSLTTTINLSLQEGWNAIHNKLTVTLDITRMEPLEFGASGNLDIKVGNPSSLYWVLNSENDEFLPLP
jgi:hypothetical protein